MLSPKSAPTWLASSSRPWPAYCERQGVSALQRNPLVVNQSIRKPTRKVPSAPEPASEVRSKPVEPSKLICSMSDRPRSSHSWSSVVGVSKSAPAEAPKPVSPKLAFASTPNPGPWPAGGCPAP
jgi:hypothetical protein